MTTKQHEPRIWVTEVISCRRIIVGSTAPDFGGPEFVALDVADGVLEGRAGRWLGPVGEEVVMLAEERLGVPMPASYRKFLLTYGSGIVDDLEIYGLGGSRKGVPNLLWLVDDLREAGLQRPPQLLPFHAEGDGDYSAILAAPLHGHPTGSVIYWSPRRDDEVDVRLAFSTLDEWFLSRLGQSRSARE